jgi:nucleoside-diphosphate-sugar epimerase
VDINQKILLTGASGWIGKSFLEVYESNFGPEITQANICATSSVKKEITLESGTIIQSLPLSDEIHLNRKYRGIVHLAALTRDKVTKYENSEYVYKNMELLSHTLQAVDKGIDWLICVSSGAVFKSNKIEFENDMNSNPYGFYKRLEEMIFSNLHTRQNFTFVCPRLWGGTGRDMKSHQNYAFGSFIKDALEKNQIVIKSGHKVYRKYIDTRDLMNLCLKMVQNKETKIFNSGGPLIEIGDLAKKISIELQEAKVIRNSVIEESDDHYYPTDSDIEVLFHNYNLKYSSIEEQIKNTIKSLK